MDAWKKSLDPEGKSGIRFLADSKGELAKALGLVLDAEAFFGNKRSQRYAIVVKDGKIAKKEVESDPTQVTVSSADKILD